LDPNRRTDRQKENRTGTDKERKRNKKKETRRDRETKNRRERQTDRDQDRKRQVLKLKVFVLSRNNITGKFPPTMRVNERP
jgi:hypothetical protein